MIPLSTRAARKKTEMTLLSYPRQCLPRPARLYSTPTKRASAPAIDAISPPPPDTYPAFFLANPRLADSTGATPSDSSTTSDMRSFLLTRTPYTIIPPPLPQDKLSEHKDLYYTDSPTRDLIAVMDACLHNGYDVPRAKEIFDGLRAKRTEDIVHPRLYTAFVEAYLNMALKEPEKRSLWVDDAWALLDSLFTGSERVAVTTGAYALALVAWLRCVNTSLYHDLKLIVSQIFFRKFTNIHRRNHGPHTRFALEGHRRQPAFNQHNYIRPCHPLLRRSR